MKFDDRYASSITSSNLRSRPETMFSDSDVLGAAGLAAKDQALAIALARLFAGDNSAARPIVWFLSDWAWTKARARGVALRRTESVAMAQAVLAWHRNGKCQECTGHGYQIVPGAPCLSDNQCPACRGTGRVPFETAFPAARRRLAGEVLSMLERELGRAGPASMAKLAPRLDL